MWSYWNTLVLERRLVMKVWPSLSPASFVHFAAFRRNVRKDHHLHQSSNPEFWTVFSNIRIPSPWEQRSGLIRILMWDLKNRSSPIHLSLDQVQFLKQPLTQMKKTNLKQVRDREKVIDDQKESLYWVKSGKTRAYRSSRKITKL